MSEGGRNARFVRTAKTMLLFQVGAGAAAIAVAAWALFEVADLARERDALAARVAQLEAVIPRAMLPPAPEPVALPDSVNAADLPAAAIETTMATNKSGGGSSGGNGDEGNGIGKSDGNIVVGETVDCQLAPNRTPSRCPVPWQRVGDLCRDVQGREAYCGRLVDPDPDPTNEVITHDEPERDCRSLEGRAIVCVPPFRRTPAPGVCLDANRRPMRCPASVRDPDRTRPDLDRSQNRQQPVTRR